MEIFDKIHKAGNTVVLVIYEEDIAQYAKRIIRLRDGVIEFDQKRLSQSFKQSLYKITSILNKYKIC